jgi:hypothetical protein
MTDHRGAAGLCRDVLSISPTAGLGLSIEDKVTRTIPRSRAAARTRGADIVVGTIPERSLSDSTRPCNTPLLGLRAGRG